MKDKASRRFFAPEVIQTSLMDCGPAALAAVLEGFGIEASYEALRERCQTDIDGTSIDALAALAAELGLASHQVLVPRDHFLLPEADCLPAIVVTRSSGGLLHFLVVWRTLGPYVQIMDPSGGRAWVRKRALFDRMPDLAIPISVEKWRRWAGSENALAPLCARMRACGMSDVAVRTFVAAAHADPSWRGFGALDAGVRMISALLEADALERGKAAEALLQSLLERTLSEGATPADGIPRRFWWVSPGPQAGKLTVPGAVIVHFSGRDEHLPAPVPPGRTREVVADRRVDPLRLVLQIIQLDRPRALGAIAIAIAASVCVAGIDVLLMRGAIDLGRFLSLDYQRAGGLLALAVFAGAGLGLELFLSSMILRVGRGRATRLRVQLLEKIPRLEDRYLRSRSTSDMASRGHQMQILREIPVLGARIARAGAGLVVTTAAIVWLHPRALGWAVAATGISVLLPFAIRRPLTETSLRLRTHAATLDRFYLDALLGVTPVRVHGAERAVCREHEALLVEWSRTARSLQQESTRLQALQALVGSIIAVALVATYVGDQRPLAALLLIAFWAFRIPAAGQELAVSLTSYRDMRNVALRIFAPLGATEITRSVRGAYAPGDPTEIPMRGVDVELRDVTVRPAGNTILHKLRASIPRGSHVAIVGPSGAGKSSLVGLLLGWLAPSEGAVLVDGEELDGDRIVRLRRELAWVDPAVQLWNRSLLDNVTFGEGDVPLDRLPEAVAGADLTEVLEALADGMQANLGEGGARVSGGQGQRVRLARALLRKQPRLVILDEPFRGLERQRRRALLARARERWRGATLLFVSHDVSDTKELDRVLVVDGGEIVEDGAPAALLADPGSRYRALVTADEALRSETWSSARWTRKTVAGGRLVDTVEQVER